MDWYYVANGERRGPVSGQEFESLVQSGAISPDTLVWNESLPEWQPHRQLARASTPFPETSPVPSPSEPMDSRQWYYVSDGERKGPVSPATFEDLVDRGTITPTTLVWNTQMPNWQTYASLGSAPQETPRTSPATHSSERLRTGEGWYYVFEGERRGPVSRDAFEDLVNHGQITMNTLVWNARLSDWQTYGSVDLSAPAQGDQVETVRVGSRGIAPDQVDAYAQQLREGLVDMTYARSRVEAKDLPRFAGFWIRFAAFLIDGLVLLAVSQIFTFALMIPLGASAINDPNARVFIIVQMVLFALNVVLAFGYYTIMHGHPKWQGSLGKLACGIRVARSDESNISYGRAFCRGVATILSFSIFLIGFIIAAFDEEKRGLHDHICDTRVLMR